MAWYKFWKNIEYQTCCYVEADSFEEAREEALVMHWDESEQCASSAWVAKAELDEGQVVDPDDDDFNDLFTDGHELYDTRSLELHDGESID